MRWIILIALASCGSPALKKVGETCSASSECDNGLLCDFGKSPSVCANKGSIDAAVMQPDAARKFDAPMMADAPPADAAEDAAVDAPTD